MSERWRPVARRVPGRDALDGTSPPGDAIIRAWSLLVPADAREAWALEWKAELLHDCDARLARGEPPSRTGLALRARALAAAADVLSGCADTIGRSGCSRRISARVCAPSPGTVASARSWCSPWR